MEGGKIAACDERAPAARSARLFRMSLFPSRPYLLVAEGALSLSCGRTAPTVFPPHLHAKRSCSEAKETRHVDVGKALSRDIAKGENVEAELDAFISRHDKMRRIREGERAEEAAWVESTRKANETRRLQNRYEWHLHHTSQAERLRNTLEDLIAHHEERAEELAELGGGDAA